MSASNNQHQMSRHDRTRGTSKVGGCDGRAEAPAADYAQGRLRSGFVGAYSRTPPRLFDAPRKTGGGCFVRSRLFSRFVPVVLASGSQLRFSDHVPAKFADRFEAAHLERLSCVSVAYDQQPIERLFTNVQISVASGARSV